MGESPHPLILCHLCFQARLRRKRALAEQRNNMISNKSTGGTKAGRPLSANIAAVEPYIQRAPQEVKDEVLKPEGGYPITKQDPKYQTLPHSLKFPLGGEGKEANRYSIDNNNKGETKANTSLQPGGKGMVGQPAPVTGPSVLTIGQPVSTSGPQPSPTGRTSAGIMSTFAPKPYGSMGSFSTALSTTARTTPGETSPIYTSSGVHLGPKTSTPNTGAEIRTNAMKEIFITGAPSQSATSQPRPAPTQGKSYLGNSTPAPYPGIGANTTTPHPATNSTTPHSGANTNNANNQRQGPPNYATSMANRHTPHGYGPRDNAPSPSSSSSSQGYYKPTTQPPPASTGNLANTVSSTGGSSIQGSGAPSWSSAPTTRPPVSTSKSDLFLPRSSANTYPGLRQTNTTTNNWHQPPGDSSSRLSSANTSNNTTSVGQDSSRTSSIGGNNTQVGEKAVPPQSLPQGNSGDSAGDDKDLDTSPTSVMSALDILKAGGPMGNAPKTYRYAPKSVIANTYMRKLGSSTLEKYRQNMSALYKDFVPGVNQGTDKTPGSPTATVRPLQQGSEVTQGAPQSYDRLSNGPATFSGGEVEKRHRPNAPRPLRRRLSQEGSTDEYPSRPGSGSRLSPTQEGFPGPKSPLGDDVFSHPQVVRVNHEQDSYDSKTSVSFHQSYGSDSTSGVSTETSSNLSERGKEKNLPAPLRNKKTNLKKKDSVGKSRRVSFDPLALLLDASLEGELELVMRTAKEVGAQYIYYIAIVQCLG